MTMTHSFLRVQNCVYLERRLDWVVPCFLNFAFEKLLLVQLANIFVQTRMVGQCAKAIGAQIRRQTIDGFSAQTINNARLIAPCLQVFEQLRVGVALGFNTVKNKSPRHKERGA